MYQYALLHTLHITHYAVLCNVCVQYTTYNVNLEVQKLMFKKYHLIKFDDILIFSSYKNV